MTLTVADEDMTGQRLRSGLEKAGPRGTASALPGWRAQGGPRQEADESNGEGVSRLRTVGSSRGRSSM